MANVSTQELLMAGAHFGHLTQRWNPKMKPFIYMQKNGIYIIDLKKTVNQIEQATNAITKAVRHGEKILFVGTRRNSKDIIRSEAERCNMFFVNDRWLGGTLTNFATIKKSIRMLRTLEKKEIDGTYENIRKKEILSIERKKEKLTRVLGGIADMAKLPGIMFVVDTIKDSIAVNEAQKLGIPVVAIVDTNCDPDKITYPIPSNDDAIKAVSLITRVVADTIIEATMSSEKMVEA
jgi:small subunit ribosomal protein S2